MGTGAPLESVRKVSKGLHNLRSIIRIAASRRDANALYVRFSKSFARRRQRLSHASVRSTSALDFPLHPDLRLLAQRRRRVFAKFTRRRLKRGVFHSVVDLQAAIKRFLAENNDNPRPFKWIKEPEAIIAAVKR